jgi:hypothetical protein
MKTFDNTLPLVLLFAFFTGCSAVQPIDKSTTANLVPSPTTWTSSGGANALLVYFDQIRSLSAPELAREIERARKNYAKDRSAFYQLQYAITLSVPGGDSRLAQQLLAPLLKENGRLTKPLHALAAMLSVDLAERQRLEESLQAQIRRADELDNKLEALKDIERKMLQRENVIKGKS